MSHRQASFQAQSIIAAGSHVGQRLARLSSFKALECQAGATGDDGGEACIALFGVHTCVHIADVVHQILLRSAAPSRHAGTQ